ncbi:MAG: phage tail fiber protein, partial [Pseudodesulfovibrio sp.]
MPITAQTTKVQYSGQASPVEEYPVPFKFMENGDLTVIHTNVDGEDTTLTLDTDYTVTGAGDDEGGTVTVTNTDYQAATGERLTIYLDMDIKQETDLQNSAAFYPEVIETALDRLTLTCQQLDN